MPTLDLNKIKHYFATQPVLKAWLFGSFARGEQREDSDVDIAVIFDPDAKVSLLDHSGIMCDLEDITGRAVDVATYDSIYPRIKKEVDKDKILIYERAY